MIYDQGDGTRYYEIVLKWKRRCFYGIMEEDMAGFGFEGEELVWF